MEKENNLLEAYSDMILLYLKSKEPNFNGRPTEIKGKTCIVITNDKCKFIYIAELDTLTVPPASVVALDVYKEFLKYKERNYEIN